MRANLLSWVAILALCAAASPARADKGKAHMTLKTAEHALDEAGCFRSDHSANGCGDADIYPAAVKKVEAALAEDTSGETLRRVCKILSQSQGPDREWAQKNGWLGRGIAVCELVGRAEDLEESDRGVGPSGADDIRRQLAELRTPAERDAHMTAAAKALYGVGLKMKFDKGKNQISLDWGDVDDAKLQEFIREYYTKYAREMVANGYLSGRNGDQLEELKKKGTWGWVLLEPKAKLEMCQKVIYNLDKGRQELGEWCGMQAVIESASPLFAFRGKSASYDAKSAGGGVAPEDRVWAPSVDGRFEPALTVAGPLPLEDQTHVEFVLREADKMVWSNSKYHPDALVIRNRAQKTYDEKKDSIARNEAKIVGGGGKVLFAAGSFDRWEPPKLLKAGDKPMCEDLHFISWHRTGHDETLLMGIEVDGKHCWAELVGNRISEPVMVYMSNIYGNNRCREALQAPGDHAVSTSLHTFKSSKTGRKVIDGNTIQDEWRTDVDKQIGTFKAQCTTKGGGNVGARYE